MFPRKSTAPFTPSLGCLLAEDVGQQDTDQGLTGAMEAVKATPSPSRTMGWSAHPELLGLGKSVLGGHVRCVQFSPVPKDGTWEAHMPGRYSHPGLGSPEGLGETLGA